MDTIKIGIIGCGIIAEQHMLRYKDLEGVEVVAACDIDEKKRESFCKRYNIPSQYYNIYELLERDDIYAVDVCLHNNSHAPVTIEAMRQGKHVYCEKPMAGSYYDAQKMLEASKQYGRKLHIQLGYLYTYETAIAKELIDSGELGHIYHMRSNGFRRRGRPFVDGYANKEFDSKVTAGGGALFDMGVYYISQLLYLTGNKTPLSITGHIYQETDMDPVRREISKYDVEEFAAGLVSFPDNVSLSIQEAWAVHMNPFEGSCIMGSKAGLRLNPLSFHTNFHDFQMDSTFDEKAAAYRESTVYSERLKYRSSQGHWIAALRGECPLLPTAEIALNTQLIQEGIYISHELGRQVTAEEVKKLSKSNALEIPNLFR